MEQVELKEECKFDDFHVDTDDVWLITNNIINEPMSGAVYVHKQTGRPMIITRSPAVVEEGEEPYFIYLFLLQELDEGEGKIMQLVDEKDAPEIMPYYLMGANDTYTKMGSLSNDKSDAIRIDMMAEIGICMAEDGIEGGVVEQPPPREPRRVLVPKKKLVEEIVEEIGIENLETFGEPIIEPYYSHYHHHDGGEEEEHII